MSICLYNMSSKTILLCYHPSIDDQGCTTNIVRGSRSQEDDCASKVLRQTPSPRWTATDNVLGILSIFSIHLGHRGLDVARTDTVDVDPLARPFVRHGFGHLKHTAFGACVGGDVVVCDEGNDGSNIDNLLGSIHEPRHRHGPLPYLSWSLELE